MSACLCLDKSGGGISSDACQVEGSISSLYLFALLMAAPLALGDIPIEVVDDLVSVPYVTMTVALVAQSGVHVQTTDEYDQFIVRSGQTYTATDSNHYVAGDASSASYFFAAAAIAGIPVTVRGLRPNFCSR